MKNASFQQMLKDYSDGTYDFTDNGECTQCGECCTNILPMTQAEINNIHKYIKKHSVREQRHTVLFANPTIDMTCPFLNTGKPKEKCEIYPVRPQICKSFICCLEKRSFPDGSFKAGCKVIDVRKEFFGECGVED